MLTQPLLILTLAATVFVPDSHSQALENSVALPFALTVPVPPKPFIEVSSTEGVYINQAHAFPLADTQCLHTKTPQVQLCIGNRWPTQIRLLLHGHLKIGLHAPSLSQLAYTHHTSPVAKPVAKTVVTKIVTRILQGIERQGDIIAAARQRSLMLSPINHNKSDDTLLAESLGAGDPEDDSEPIAWWGIAQRPAPDTNDSDTARVRLDNDILLKPDTRYCFALGPGPGAQAYGQAVPNEGSGNEDNGSSDENSDNDSDEEKAETDIDPDVEYISTTADPFPVAKEIREYCASLEQRKIKQEPPSDSEMPIEPGVEVIDNTRHSSLDRASERPIGSTVEVEVVVAAADSTRKLAVNQAHLCQVCGKTFAQKSRLKRHLRAHSGEKPHPCQECGKRFTQKCHLKEHLRTHSGEKPYLCQKCGKAFAQNSQLKRHLRTHSGEKPYQCKVCDKAFAHSSHLKRHLRVHSGEKPYRCKECGKAFTWESTLKTHLRTHRTAEEYPIKRQCVAHRDEDD